MRRTKARTKTHSTRLANHPEALRLHRSGLEQFAAGNLTEAQRLIAQAVIRDPLLAVAQRDLGEMYRRHGQLELALACGKAAAALGGADAELSWFNYAMALLDNQQPEEARLALRRAVAIKPEFSAAQDRLAALERMPIVAPQTPEETAIKRQAQRTHEKGIQHYRHGEYALAMESYVAALALNPECPYTLNSQGYLLQEQGDLAGALACFERAVALAPDLAMARLNLGMLQLKLGDFKIGWENYEARWAGSAEALSGIKLQVACPLPHWNGDAPPEQRQQHLLVLNEQGFGDVLQFSRYLPLAAERFASVSFIGDEQTMRLLEWSFGDKVNFLSSAMLANHTVWDGYCHLLSLPRAFATTLETIPAIVPYLKIPVPAHRYWQARLEKAAPQRLRVGLAWAGRKAHLMNARRNIDFSLLAPLVTEFSEQGVSWICLQKWLPEDLPPPLPVDANWIDWSGELNDFAATAALVDNLDLVISIDSAMVHLAGALAKPVWLLNRFDNEWRWLHERQDSPWYPTLRIFRQPSYGDWPSVVREVQAALAQLLAFSSSAHENTKEQVSDAGENRQSIVNN